MAVLALGAAGPPSTQAPPAPQAPAPEDKPKDQFFAGLITALSSSQITVTRTVLGEKSSTRTFAITRETRVEGKPKLKTRVTVQFVTTEEGDRAIQIIVRSASQKKPG